MNLFKAKEYSIKSIQRTKRKCFDKEHISSINPKIKKLKAESNWYLELEFKSSIKGRKAKIRLKIHSNQA